VVTIGLNFSLCAEASTIRSACSFSFLECLRVKATVIVVRIVVLVGKVRHMAIGPRAVRAHLTDWAAWPTKRSIGARANTVLYISLVRIVSFFRFDGGV